MQKEMNKQNVLIGTDPNALLIIFIKIPFKKELKHFIHTLICCLLPLNSFDLPRLNFNDKKLKCKCILYCVFEQMQTK